MGNRAIITTKNQYENDGYGLYLHWNGGRDSVEAFLAYCRLKGYRDPIGDEDYALARLCQVIGNFFGGTTSLGICPARCGAGDDNGVYIIGKDWQVVGRKEVGEHFIEQNEYPLGMMLHDIDRSMPEGEQLQYGATEFFMKAKGYEYDNEEVR